MILWFISVCYGLNIDGVYSNCEVYHVASIYSSCRTSYIRVNLHKTDDDEKFVHLHNSLKTSNFPKQQNFLANSPSQSCLYSQTVGKKGDNAPTLYKLYANNVYNKWV